MQIFTAPMAVITDYSYRKILEKFSPDLIFTEMVNSSLLSKDDNATENILLKCGNRRITATQVFGSVKEEIVASFLKLEQMGYSRINLNMGCPQPKIIKKGAGAALLPRIDFIDDLLFHLKCILKNSTKISLKLRLSYKEFDSPEIYLELAEKYGLDFICVHGRSQEQMYSGKADWKRISGLSLMKRSCTFIGNGDLFSPEDLACYSEKANLDGIMLARGIIGNPWLITQAREFFSFGKVYTFPSFNDIKYTLLEHFDLLYQNKGKVKASLEINKFIKPYFKNFLTEDLSKFLTSVILEKDYTEKKKSILSL